MHRPTNQKELFNLRHASARNVIERAFGVLKNRFRILLLPVRYTLEIQARIPVALCAIHNFITLNNPVDVSDDDYDDLSGSDEDDDSGDDEDDEDNPRDDGARNLRDQIASTMWNDYVELRRAQGFGINNGIDDM